MRYGGKRQLLAQLTGYTALRWARRAPGAYVFNYHRIGNPETTAFDPNVFSCSVERFQEQIRFFQKHFDLVSIDELLEINRRERISARCALITFDDGYLDNFELALPILREEKAAASFFLSTEQINNDSLQWWDEIAWMINHTTKTELALQSGRTQRLEQQNRATIIQSVLNEFKSDASRTAEEKVAYLREALEVEYQEDGNRLFMNWDQVREVHNSGLVEIGSHTISHRILSHLSPEDQLWELTESKKELEAKIGSPVRAFAYPVGLKTSFTPVTVKLVEQAGYEIGFNFITGENPRPWENRFSLYRFGVDDDCDTQYIKYQVGSLR